MRIALMGQAAFGARVLEALLEKGETIVAVYSPPDRPHGQEDPLTTIAKEKHVSIYQPVSYKDSAVCVNFQSISPDLLIMAYVTAMIPHPFLRVPTQGAICYHPSLLPRHRGASAINWAVIMGDDLTGLTIFWADEGIDTGPILLQKEVPIRPDDTTGSLYFNVLFPMGIEAIVESVDLIKTGKAPRIPQDEHKATYEPPCDEKVAQIDWFRPGKEIHNLIRGCDPQPGAFSFWRNEKITFYQSRFTPVKEKQPSGMVLGISEEHLIISTEDGIIEIGKIRTSDLGKVEISKFRNQSGIKEGDRFVWKINMGKVAEKLADS